MPAARSDEDLMECYRDGDASAFDELYRRHRGALYRYILRLTRDAAQAGELGQDVWIKLIKARASYQPSALFRTYLFRIAHNRVVDHFRGRGIDRLLVDDDEGEIIAQQAIPPARGPEQQVDLQRRLIAALDALPPAQREAFLLHEEAGLDIEQIASVTGEQREAIKSRLRYAVTKLRRQLADG
jgi:RNA polymerase sigma-70 factor (ECF subfamily)